MHSSHLKFVRYTLLFQVMENVSYAIHMYGHAHWFVFVMNVTMAHIKGDV